MERTEQFEVVIETDGRGVDVRLINEFFYNFRAVYAASVLNAERMGPVPPSSSYESASNWLQLYIDGTDWRVVSHFANVDLDENNLEIVDIRRENPLSVVFTGAFIALTIAVILSGGKIEAGPLKVKLPPLGTGIAKLRKALRRPRRHGDQG